MKNNKYFFKLLLFFILFFQFNFLLSDEFEFKAARVETSNNNNIIKGFGDVEINDKVDLIITGQQFEYNKSDLILNVNDNVLIKDIFCFLLLAFTFSPSRTHDESAEFGPLALAVSYRASMSARKPKSFW